MQNINVEKLLTINHTIVCYEPEVCWDIQWLHYHKFIVESADNLKSLSGELSKIGENMAKLQARRLTISSSMHLSTVKLTLDFNDDD